MSTFIELVILPALLPWLITLVTGWVEDRLDQQDGFAAQRDYGAYDERRQTRSGCMVLDIPSHTGVTVRCQQD